LNKCFEDKASGKDTNRPELQAALAFIRTGDTLIVHSIDRLARSLADLEKLIEGLNGRGVEVQFVKEGLRFRGATDDDPMAVLMRQMLGAVAQFERSMIRERQREGIAIAKAAGRYKGGTTKLKPEQVTALAAKDEASGGKGRTVLAKEYGISRETLYKHLETAGRIVREPRATVTGVKGTAVNSGA
jgi:DNA invertase Pin-like site-specific DNA recombinase